MPVIKRMVEVVTESMQYKQIALITKSCNTKKYSDIKKPTGESEERIRKNFLFFVSKNATDIKKNNK